MKLPKQAIKNHHFTLIIVILLLVFGIYSFITMPRSEDPQIDIPGARIIVVYPGANPIDMEHLIVDPIEEVINEIEDIFILESSSGKGLSIIDVEFIFGVDSDDKYSKVVDKVNGIRSNLPENIQNLEFIKWDVGSVNILQLALVSDTDNFDKMKNKAEELKDLFERISGVRTVKILACPDQEVHISLDLERLAQMNIPFTQIITAVKSSNANIPGGSIDAGGKKFNIHTSGSFRDLEEIKTTIVASYGGNVVYLKDVADIYFGYKDMDYHARYNGKRAIFITVNQKNKTNIFTIMDKLNSNINTFKKTLPETMSIHSAFDQSKSVENRFNMFFSNLLQGILLVGILVFIGVGFRASIIVMMAIPLSLFIGIGFVNLSGFSLEQISISGLVIVLGILVDNAIVVTENTTRFIEMGYSHEEAAIKGTSQIGWAITSATATTLFAFLPLIMMRNKAGDFIRSMPVTVIFTLTVSLLLALSFTPLIATRILKKNHKHKKGIILKKLNTFISTYYRMFLDWCLSHTKIVILTAIGILSLCVMIFILFVGVSFFPKAEKPQFIIDINTPVGSSIDATDKAVHFVENILLQKTEISHFASSIGKGNPRIYYNMFAEREKSHFAQIFIQLKSNNPKIMKKLRNDLRIIFKDFAGAKIEVKELEQGPPIEAPIAIKILARNLENLEEISRDVENIFQQTEGLININNPLKTNITDIHIHINREKAGILGLNLVDIDKTIRAFISGLTISSFRDFEGQDYDIVLKLKQGSPESKPVMDDFNRIYLSSYSGAQIPLMQIASIQLKSSPLEITHYNLQRSVTITGDVLDGFSAEKATKDIIKKLEEYNWPARTLYHIAGEMEGRKRSFGGMNIAVIIAIIAIFGILVLQFRSFIQPFIILSSLPLAFIGSILALFFSGYSFSFTAFVGLTSLVGIVVNDAIILVDYTNQLVREGKDLISALKEAGEIRFISIILTSFTTIGGLLPLTLRGGSLWAPMGWTIIGGLFTSTALTLIVVPVLYKIFANLSNKFKNEIIEKK